MLVLRFCGMAEPLPVLVESSLQIAWDFLGGVGEIADPQQTAEFLLQSIQSQMLRGETRTLRVRPETSGRIAEFSEHEAD